MDKDHVPIEGDHELAQQIVKDFDSLDNWEKDYRACCAMRGVGWVILSWDPVAKRLFNIWVNQHDVGHLVGTVPLLVTDVWEHAYVTDFGIKRPDYIDAFFKSINWKVVSKRFEKK